MGVGNYYVISVFDLLGIVESYEGYLLVFVKDDVNKLFNFIFLNFKKVYIWLIINGWLDL